MPKFSNISPSDHIVALQNLERAWGSVGQLFAAQTAFSLTMFGDCNFRGPAAVLDHVRKEVEEIAHDPINPTQWADLAILALDGLQRANWLTNNVALSEKPPTAAKDVLIGKMHVNFQRDWPALSEQDPNRAVEHVRSEAELEAKAAELRDVATAMLGPAQLPKRSAPAPETPAHYAKAFNQLAHYDAIVAMAGYDNLPHFLLTALADLGHVEPTGDDAR